MLLISLPNLSIHLLSLKKIIMDTSTFIIAALISALIWAVIIYSIISSASRSKEIVKLLKLMAEKQGASEDEIFKATKSEDEIFERERKLKKELKKKQL